MKEPARNIATYAAALILCVLALVIVLKLWQADLNVPFMYWYDGLLANALIKGVLDNGWYLHNAYLGAPGALDLHDFPMAEGLHFAVIKLLGLVCPSHAAVFNLFFLLTFPLTTLTALAALRQFGVGRPAALAASLLYAFLPYHLFRNESHLFLSAYYLVPPAVMVALWVFLGAAAKPQAPWHRARLATAILVCLLVSSAGVYYAVFTGFFLLVAGAAASLRDRRLAPALLGLLLVGVIAAGGIANLAPSLSYRWQHGRNPSAVDRSPAHAEIYALRVSQLVLPISFHRLRPVARFKEKYNTRSPLINENDTSSLGLIGACGFLALVGLLLTRRQAGSAASALDGLVLFNGFALLLAGMGGFGSFASFTLGPWLRGYCRMSVFIGFFALFAVALFLDQLAQRFAQTGRGRAVYVAAIVLLVAAGLFDQTVTPWELEQLKPNYRHEEAFVQSVEASLPANAMVFQLPYIPFPEASQAYMDGLPRFDHGVPTGHYDPLRCYLHSRTLRWSYGSMKGRPGDRWYGTVAQLPAEAMVRQLVQAGFGGVWIQRALYADYGRAVESELSGVLGTAPRVDNHQRFAFFPLEPFAQRLGLEKAAGVAKDGNSSAQIPF